jgi:hypothetical protein
MADLPHLVAAFSWTLHWLQCVAAFAACLLFEMASVMDCHSFL